MLGAALGAALLGLGPPPPAQASLIGNLSGTITGGGAPLAQVWVVVSPVHEDGSAAGNPTRILTDSAGRYALPEVYWQAVKVQARAPARGALVDTYWPAAYSFGTAGIVEISSWPVTADIDLPRGGSVQGTVLERETGTPVPDAIVAAWMTGPGTNGAAGVHEAVSEPGGFRLVGLPPVPVRLSIRLPAGSRLLEPPFDTTYPSQELRLDGSRQTTDLVVALRRGAEVRGTVRDDLGRPVAGAEVQITRCQPACPPHAYTDDAGAYRIPAIPPGGDLRVFTPGGTRLLPQWYRGAQTVFTADALDLASGQVLDGVDFALTRGGFAAVRVLAADTGQPLVGAFVTLVSQTDQYTRLFGAGSPEDPSDQRLGPAAPGSYVLNVRPGASNPGYLAVDRYTDPALAPGGVVELAGGQTRDLVVRLPARIGVADAAGSGGAGTSGEQQPWPGLGARFGAEQPWGGAAD